MGNFITEAMDNEKREKESIQAQKEKANRERARKFEEGNVTEPEIFEAIRKFSNSFSDAESEIANKAKKCHAEDRIQPAIRDCICKILARKILQSNS